MVRTQVQFTEDQFKKLKEEAHNRNVSMAELVRRSVHDTLTSASDSRKSGISRILAVTGKFRSKSRDVSIHHDRYFVRAISK